MTPYYVSFSSTFINKFCVDYHAGKTAATAFRGYPNNFVYSGNVYNGSVKYRGTYGYYWSSTAASRDYTYCFLNIPSFVYSGTSNSAKYYEWSIRCVADD